MYWIKVVYFILMFLALLASFWGYGQKKYVLFIPLLAISLVTELARDFIRPQYPGLEPWLDLYVVIEYIILSYIISMFLISRSKKMLIRASIFILTPIFLINIFGEPLLDVKYLNHLISAPFLCVWTIFYLFEIANTDEEFDIKKNPMFWISLGNLLFFSGSFFSYGFGGYLAEKGNDDLADTILWIARSLNILLYILYITGFLCLKRKT
ncbi:MAG TPA: hypothetical protein VGD17_00410 [Chitinophagaceae bacterium]